MTMSVSESVRVVRQEIVAKEQQSLLEDQTPEKAIQRMATTNMPYDIKYPPCHIRIKQAAFLTGTFLGGVGTLAGGASIVGNGFGPGSIMIFVGLLPIVYSVYAAIATSCAPGYQTLVIDPSGGGGFIAGDYKARRCLPCIGWPCNYYVCHCTDIDDI